VFTRAFVLSAAVAALFAFAPAAQAQDACAVPSRPLCTGGDKVAERGAAECRRAAYAGARDPDECPALPLGRRVSQAAIREYEASWLHGVLAFQHDIAGDVPFVDAPWIGTHNSFNDPNEQPTLSHTDSNQQLGLGDQLRVDVRSLELDVHWIPSPRAGGAYSPVVCHGQGQYAGCTTERLLAERLPEVSRWLDANPDQVLLLYIQDEIYDAAGYKAALEVLRHEELGLGTRLYLPPDGEGCKKLPLGLSRDDVLRAGAQVVIVSGCGGLAPVAFDWPGDVRFESRPHGFGDPGCRNDGADVPYSTRLVRMYEDSTWLTASGERAGASRADDGITPETAARMLACGVDLLGFDQLLPDDGRLAALAWSWAAGEPRAGKCARMDPGGRWSAGPCSRTLPVACRADDGHWRALSPGTAEGRGKALRAKRWKPGSACLAAGLQFAAPRTAVENAALAASAGGRRVLLGLRRTRAGFVAQDRR
jgi:hypothetical protein